jgi:hypothetical protein
MSSLLSDTANVGELELQLQFQLTHARCCVYGFELLMMDGETVIKNIV